MAHIGVDAESGLVHTVIGMPANANANANANDVTQAAGLLHGQETHLWGDAGHQGVDKREELKDTRALWHVACGMWRCDRASAER